MKSRIYLSSPHMGGSELKYIHEAFGKNWIAPLGPNVDAFEEALAEYCRVKHAAALSSGTAAIHIGLIMLDVKPGDYVIGSSFTFSASINPIAYQGAIPVLVDSEADTWNMNPVLLEQAILACLEGKLPYANPKPYTHTITPSPHPPIISPSLPPSFPPFPNPSIPKVPISFPAQKPKAIIIVHLYGMPARMKEIIEIASKYDIPVIEDAAEALGSEYMGKRVGCNGKFGILSFNGNKIITTSGGGALLSDDEALIKRARFLATQARDPAPHYQHSVIGYNYRMSNIVAGIGRGQMEVLDERVRQRRAINQWYRELLKDIPGVTFQTEPSKDFFSNYWLTCIVIDPAKAGTDREKLRLALEIENIEARPLWKPMHLQPVFKEAPAFVNGTSQRLFENGLCLPSGSNLTDIELARISEVLKRQFRI